LPVICSKLRASAGQRFNCLYRCAFPRLAGGSRADPGQGRPGVCRWRSRPDGRRLATAARGSCGWRPARTGAQGRVRDDPGGL